MLTPAYSHINCRPVDVSAKEKAVAERLDKEREVTKERLAHQQPMSRTSSRAGSDRTGTPKIPQSNSVPPSPRATSAVASIRPAFSFADAAGAKKAAAAAAAAAASESREEHEESEPKEESSVVKDVTEQLGEVTI